MGLATLGLHGESRQGVGGFTRLRHPNGEGVGRQRRRGIAKFTGVINRRWQPGELFQQVGTHQSRVATGATGQDLNPLNAAIKRGFKGKRHGHLRC